MGNIAALHQDLVETRLVSESQFAEAIAIGQISPGPNGLWAVSLGYIMRGPLGALLVVLGILVPPFLVLASARLFGKLNEHAAAIGFIRFLALGVVGIFAVAMFRLLESVGFTAFSILIAAAAFACAHNKRIPVVAIIATGAVVGVLSHR